MIGMGELGISAGTKCCKSSLNSAVSLQRRAGVSSLAPRRYTRLPSLEAVSIRQQDAATPRSRLFFRLAHPKLSSKATHESIKSCCRRQFDRRPQRQITRPWQSISHRRRSPSPMESQFYTTISPAQRRQSHGHNAAAWPSFPKIPLRHQTTQMMEKLQKS